MNKIIFKSMSIALSATDTLKRHGIISKPVRSSNPKCGCCVELIIYNSTLTEVIRVLETHAFKFEMSE